MVDFPKRKWDFRVCGWFGAFWGPLERKKEKTKCIYKIVTILHRSDLQISKNFADFRRMFTTFGDFLQKTRDFHKNDEKKIQELINFAEILNSERCKRMQLL